MFINIDDGSNIDSIGIGDIYKISRDKDVESHVLIVRVSNGYGFLELDAPTMKYTDGHTPFLITDDGDAMVNKRYAIDWLTEHNATLVANKKDIELKIKNSLVRAD